MVAIVTGSGLGLLRDSGLVLGSRGQLGSASLGQANLGVTVNAANGNLVLQSTDEILIGKGPDDIVANTYNSQGTFTANDWQENFQRHVAGLTGTVNTSGSTITRYAADGSVTVYTYDTTKALYVGNEGGGAYDTLAYSAGVWTWVEGKSRNIEKYDDTNGGRLTASKDADLNTLTYTYTGSQLTKITTASGDYTTFAYTGTLLTSIVTSYTDGAGLHSRTRTYYGYDASNRLQTVTVDHTPSDNSVTDNNTYVTTYTYDGTSTRIASISQSDGTSLQIAYVQVGSVYKVSSLTQLVSSYTTPNPDVNTYAVTSFDYSVAGQTTVTDALGNQTVMVYDANGQLTKLTEPAATANADPQTTVFTYDANGNLLYSGPSSDPMFTNIGLNWNDLVTSGSGVTTTQSTEVDGGVAVYRRQTTTTPASGWNMRLAQSQPAWTPVNPGQTVQFSILTASTGASSLRLYMMFRDASGAQVYSTYATIAAGGTVDANGVANAILTTKSYVAPAGAVYVELNVQAYADGTAPLNVAIAQPMISVDGSGLQPAYAYTYDTSGNLLTRTDSLGNQTVFTYDGNNQMLTKTTSSSTGTSQTTRYVYDAESHLVYTISPLGEVTRYIYNSYGQQTSAIQYTMASDMYDVSSLSSSASPSEAQMTTWVGQTHDLVRSRRTDMVYDARGALMTLKTYTRTNSSGSGNSGYVSTIGYVYGPSGELLSRTLADGTESYLYDGLLRLTSRTDVYGNVTQTLYNNTTVDANGWLTRTSVTTLANSTTTVTSVYDLAGELIKSTTRGLDGVSATPTYISAATIYEYDLNGNLVQTTDPTGISHYYVYDDRNRKVADVAPDGTVTAYTYNENDQVVASVGYATALTTTQLSALANESASATLSLTDVTPATSASDRWGWNVYDAAGQLVETIDALGYATVYAYDDAGNLVSTTRYANAISSTTVTGFKTAAPLSIVLPTVNATYDRTTRTLYDADGRIVGGVDADGYLTQTVYDDTGLKIRTIAYANKPSSVLATDSILDLVGKTTTSTDDIYNWFVYDNASHLVASIDGEGNSVRYDNYTDTGYAETVTRGQIFNPTTLIGTPPVFTLPTATGTLEITNYDYNEYGHVRSKTLTLADGSSEITTYTYDQLYNLTSFRVDSSTAADGSGDRRKAVYHYDGLNRLLGTLSGIGSASLAAAPTQTQIDNLWTANSATYGTTYTYDLAGRRTSQADADGDKTLFYYDGNGRLAYQVGPDGQVIQYAYDAFGEQKDVTRYTSFISTSGLSGGAITATLTNAIAAIAGTAINTHTDYDVAGNVVDTIDALGKTTAYTYDAFDDVLTVTDPLTVVTKNTYSRRSLLLTSTADYGTGKQNLVTTSTYDAFGRVQTVTDPNSIARSMTYFRTGNVKTRVDRNAKTTSYTYDTFGHVKTVVDRNGKTTTYTYTQFDRQVTVKDVTNVSVTTVNNAYGQAVKTIDGNGTSTAAYDADGNLVTMTDALGQVTARNVYDAADRLVYNIDGVGAVTGYLYDKAGEVTQTKQYAVIYTNTGLPTTSDMATWVSANGSSYISTRTAYDGEGRVAYTIGKTGLLTQFNYDTDGRVIQQVQYAKKYTTSGTKTAATLNTWVGTAGNADPTKDIVTRFAYDADGRLVYSLGSTVYTTGATPVGSSLVTGYSYDSVGNLLQKTQYAAAYTANDIPSKATLDSWATGAASAANDRTTRNVYDKLGQLTYTADPAGTVTKIVYDNEGRVLQTLVCSTFMPAGTTNIATWADAQSGNTTRSVYDGEGRVLYSVDPIGAVKGYIYDDAGRVLQSIAYTTLMPLSTTNVATWAAGKTGETTASIYDYSDGNLAYTIDASGAVVAYTYDANGRVTQKLEYAATASTGIHTLLDMTNWAALPSVVAKAADNRTTSYTYDADGQLTSVTDPLGYVTRYTYDAYGRQAYIIDPAGGVTAYAYDANGMVTKTTRYATVNSSIGIQSLTQMQAWVTANANSTNDISTQASYSVFGTMLTATEGNGYVTTFTYDLDGRVLTSMTAANTTAGLKTVDVYNIFGDRVQVTDPLGNSGFFYYDKAGRQVLQVDAQGYATGTVYDAYGHTQTVTRYYNATSGASITNMPGSLPDAGGRDNTTSFTYYADGLLKSSTDGNNYTTSYEYDAFGNRTKMTNAAGGVVTYTYNALNLLDTQTSPSITLADGTTVIPATHYDYDTFGNRKTMTEGYKINITDSTVTAQRTTAYVYDKDDHLLTQSGDTVTITAANGTTSSVTPSQTFTYDSRGNQTSITDANGGKTVMWYDVFNRKTTQVDAMTYLTTWGYDKSGNTTSQIRYDDAVGSQMPSSPPPAPAQGNVNRGRKTVYTYDKDDRLTQTQTGAVVSGQVTPGGVLTGSWTTGSWSANVLTTSTQYDADGNAIRQTDANGNNSYTYYDNLGRVVAQVDAGLYVTKFTLDAEGNVTKQTQYANALATAPAAGGTLTMPASDPVNDRITDYTYDHDGQRLSEKRENVTYYTIDANTGALSVANTATLGVSFTYNSLGQVMQKTEATGDATVYQYDTMGRAIKVTTAYGAANSMTTATTYDALGNITQTVAYSGAAGGSPNDANAEKTVFTYGAGGRLASKTDAMGFVVSYGYDANGNTTFQSYTRKLSDGTTTVVEATVTSYDALGQVILTTKASKPGTTWVQGDTTDTFYDAYGEVIARGTNAGRNSAKAQQYADYDAAGRVWRTNMEDGVAKIFGYDKNGNQTLQITSLGTTDLSAATITSTSDAYNQPGTFNTYNIYDARNELVDVKKLTNANADGTLVSASTVSTGPTTVNVTQYNVAGYWSGYCVNTIRVNLSTGALSKNINPNGTITVNVFGQIQTFPAGTTDCGEFTIQIPNPLYDGQPMRPTQNNFTVMVTENTSGGTVTLANMTFTAMGGNYNHDFTTAQTASVGSGIEFRGIKSTATALKMYVRPAGSSGAYALVDAAQMFDTDSNAVPGGFTCDSLQAPFSGAANSSWDVKYLATDAQGNVVDAKAGTITFNSASPAVPAASGFVSVPAFTATASGGNWTLANTTFTPTYSDIRQTFDAFGDVLTQVDANNNTTILTYDVLGSLTKKESPTVTVVGEDTYGNVTTTQAKPTDLYYYDKSGRLIAHKDANGNLTTQSLLAGTGYGGSDALTTTQFNPDTGKIVTSYDIFGNVLGQSDDLGVVITNTYDADNRLKTSAHADRTSADAYTSGGITQLIDTYGYDGLGQRVTHSNNVLKNSQNTTAVETTDYDLQGRVTKTVDFGAQVTTYTYAWTAGTATTRVSAGQTNSGYWTTTTAAFGKASSTTKDTFGTLLTSVDYGAHAIGFTYNLAGQVIHQGGTGTGTQSIDYSYTLNGQMATATDNMTGMRGVYAYDNNGNRTAETYYHAVATPAYAAEPSYYQNAAISYDALNRVAEIKDVKADITYSYDANGNRRHILSVYDQAGAASETDDYWYKYDKMNRFVLTKGTLSGTTVVAGTTGVSLTYDIRGERITATYGSDSHVEAYSYSADGYIETVKINNVRGATRTNDALGRMTGSTEYQTDGTTVVQTRSLIYDNKSRVTDETDLTYSTSGGSPITYKSHVLNSYVSGGYDLGVLVQTSNAQTSIQNGTESSAVTTITDNSYLWWGSAQTSTVVVHGYDPANPNGYQWLPGNVNYTYDVNGNLTQVHDGDPANNVNRTVTYQTDMFGQVMTRQDTDGIHVGLARSFLYLNGQTIGDFGNDKLKGDTDYARQLQTDRDSASSAGVQFYPGRAVVSSAIGANASFDTYQAYNASTVSQSGSSYTATGGESLQAIAQNMWGDSSLWYVLAEANGLNAGAVVSAGRTLVIPNNVTIAHNNANSFKPYDPADALGNTTPTLPKEPQPPAPKQGCGMMGDILATIVSAAVSYFLGPVAGDVARQLTEMAVGNQKSFNWKELGTAIASAYVTQFASGLTKLLVPDLPAGAGIFQTAWHAIEINAINQGVKMALGLQKKFDWKGLASAGVNVFADKLTGALVPAAKNGQSIWADAWHAVEKNAITQGVNMAFGLQKKFDWTGMALAGVDTVVNERLKSWENKAWPDAYNGKGEKIAGSETLSGRALSGVAQILAESATRSIVTGADFGKSVLDAIPQVAETFGSTIGNMIADGMQQPGANGKSLLDEMGDGIKSFVHGVEHVGSEIIHGIEHVGSEIIHGVEHVGSEIADGVEHLFAGNQPVHTVGDSPTANYLDGPIYRGANPFASSGYGTQLAQNALFRQVLDGNGNWVDADAATGTGGVGIYKTSALTLAPGLAGDAGIGALRLAGLTEAGEALGLYAGIFSRFSVLTMPLVLSGDTPQPRAQETRFGDLVLKVTGPDHFSKTGAEIGDPGTSAVFYTDKNKGYQFFGWGDQLSDRKYLDVTVSVVHGDIVFDRNALSKAYGKDLPLSLTQALDATEDNQRRTTCAAIGFWAPENTNGWSANSIAYQGFITGHPNQQFIVAAPMLPSGKISFDGCLDLGNGVLLQEAKGNYSKVFEKGWAQAGVLKQGINQQLVVSSLKAEGFNVNLTWFVQGKSDTLTIQNLFSRRIPPVAIPVVHAPMPKGHL